MSTDAAAAARIEAILAEHEPCTDITVHTLTCRESDGSYHGYFDNEREWRAHVASEVVRELELKLCRVPEYNNPYAPFIRRYCTPWEREPDVGEGTHP